METPKLTYEEALIKLGVLRETALTLNNDMHRISRRAFFVFKSIEEVETTLLEFESDEEIET